MKLVVPMEITEGESRVSITPDCIQALIKMGFKVFVQKMLELDHLTLTMIIRRVVQNMLQTK